MRLRRTSGISRLHMSVVSDELGHVAGGATRRRFPQLVVLATQGGNINRADRIGQTRCRPALAEQDRELSGRKLDHRVRLFKSGFVNVRCCANRVPALEGKCVSDVGGVEVDVRGRNASPERPAEATGILATQLSVSRLSPASVRHRLQNCARTIGSSGYTSGNRL